MGTLTFAIIAALILGFGLISRRIQTTPITSPMVFVVFGLVVGNEALGLSGRRAPRIGERTTLTARR